MRFPRFSTVAAALVPVILLGGCAVSDQPGDDSSSSSAAPDDAAVTSIAPNGDIEDLAVELVPAPLPTDETGATATAAPGAPSEVPSITYAGGPFAEGDLPFSVPATEVKQLEPGTGAAATTEQDVEVRYILVNGTSGAEITSTFPTDETVVMPLYNPQLLPGLVTSLTGAKVGQSMIIAMPPVEAFGPSGFPDRGIAPADTIVAYVEVVAATTPLTQAEGEEVAPVAGLPTVEADGVSPAVITIPAGEDPPGTLTVQPLIKGEGKAVQAGNTIKVHYTGVTWSTGEQFDSSLQEGAQAFETPIGLGRVIPAWDEGLVGQTVGSRVLLIAPPVTAYGETKSDQAPLGGETLVFVVDILSAN